jgi:hypothetical protein
LSRKRWPTARAGGNLDGGPPVERRDLEIAAESRLDDADGNIAHEIVPFAPKHRMRLDAQVDVGIPGRTAADPVVSFTGDPHALAVVDARGYAHLDALVPPYASPGACDRARDRNLDGRPVDGVAERQAHLELEILAARHAAARGPAAPTATAAEQLEDVGQIAEPQILEVDRRALERIEARLERIVPAAVVLGLLFGIREDRERSGDFLELLFRALVPGVDVRMVLAGETAVGGLDVLLGGGARHTEHLVIVPFRGHGGT